MNKFLINNEYKEPFAVRIMEDKEKFTIFIIGIVLFLLLFTFLMPFSPLNIWSVKDKVAYAMMVEQNKQELQELVDSYNNNGVSLSENDYKLVVEENEDGSKELLIQVNENKKEEFRSNTQNKLDQVTKQVYGTDSVIGDRAPNSPVNWNHDKDVVNTDTGKNPTGTKEDLKETEESPADNKIDNTTEQETFPTIEEIIIDTNKTLENINIYLTASIENDHNLQIPSEVSELLLQRQDKNKNDDDPYSIFVEGENGVTTYREAQKRLNGQTFRYVNMNQTVLNHLEYFNIFYFNTYSSRLFKSILDNKLYTLQFNPNANYKLDKNVKDSYTLYVNGNSFKYDVKFTLTLENYKLIYGVGIDKDYKQKYILLDIELIDEEVVTDA